MQCFLNFQSSGKMGSNDVPDDVPRFFFCYGRPVSTPAIMKTGQQPKANCMSTAKRIFYCLFDIISHLFSLQPEKLNFYFPLLLAEEIDPANMAYFSIRILSKFFCLHPFFTKDPVSLLFAQLNICISCSHGGHQRENL